MSKKKAVRKLIHGKNVYFAAEGTHPSQVSGIFKDDPAYAEFLEILREQREEDYRRRIDEIDKACAAETKTCSSSTRRNLAPPKSAPDPHGKSKEHATHPPFRDFHHC
jgi:hypothetical protein